MCIRDSLTDDDHEKSSIVMKWSEHKGKPARLGMNLKWERPYKQSLLHVPLTQCSAPAHMRLNRCSVLKTAKYNIENIVETIIIIKRTVSKKKH